MRLCLYHRIQHDVVFRVGRPLLVNELGFAHACSDINKHSCILRHPFLPFSLHLCFSFLPLSRIGLLPVGHHRRRDEVSHKKSFHPLLLLLIPKWRAPAPTQLVLPIIVPGGSKAGGSTYTAKCGDLTGPCEPSPKDCSRVARAECAAHPYARARRVLTMGTNSLCVRLSRQFVQRLTELGWAGGRNARLDVR